MKPEKLTKESLKILAEVDAINLKYKLCNHRMEPVLNATTGKTTMTARCNGGQPCCTGCKFLTKSGCSTVSPACKFWFCEAVRQKMPVLVYVKLLLLFIRYKQPFHWRGDEYPISREQQHYYFLPRHF